LYEGETFLYGGNVVWFTPFKKDLISYINNHGKGSVDNFFIVSVVDLEINKPLDIRWYSSTFCGWNIIADIISTNGYGAGYINPKAPERTMGKVLTLVARWDITHYAQVKGYDSLIMRDYPGTNSSMKGESYVVFSSSQITNPRTIKVSLSKKNKNDMEKKSISNPVRKNLDYQMEMGMEEEKEHRDTYNDVVNDVENDGVIDMTFEEFTSDIASDHLEEDEQYYTKLKKVMNTKNEKTTKQDIQDINKQTQEIKKIREEMEEEFDEWHKEDSEKLKNKAMVQNIKDGIEDIRNEYKKIMAEVVDEVPETEEVTEVIGDEANVSMEPSIETVVDTMEPVQEEITPTNTFYNICSEQGASQIYSQLLEQFKANFPTSLTYKNIFQTASGAGLVESMDRYELISIMNMVAQEVSLPRIDFAGYFQPEDELIERGDIRGHENSITYNNDDVDVNEVMSEYDNESPSLFSIDRILDERLKMMNWNVGDVVEQSKAMLRDKLKGIKKNAMISKYLLLDVKANKISTNGNMIDGIVKYQVRLQTLAGNRNRRVTKDIEIPIEIRGEKIVHPREFVYKGENMPLSTYFLNDVMEK